MEAAWSWTFLYIFMQQCGELLNHNTIYSLIWRPDWQSDCLHQFPMAADSRLLLLLPTSSARIILVSLDGCVERAWRTAFREQPLMWSSSTAWMLATSGLVEDLKNKGSDKSYTLPGYFITYCCYKILLCSTVNYTFRKPLHVFFCCWCTWVTYQKQLQLQCSLVNHQDHPLWTP